MAFSTTIWPNEIRPDKLPGFSTLAIWQSIRGLPGHPPAGRVKAFFNTLPSPGAPCAAEYARPLPGPPGCIPPPGSATRPPRPDCVPGAPIGESTRVCGPPLMQDSRCWASWGWISGCGQDGAGLTNAEVRPLVAPRVIFAEVFTGG